MMRVLKIKIILLLLLLPFVADASSVYVSRVDGEIKTGTVQYLERALSVAEKENADYFVIELDTPGGLLHSTKKIVDSLLETDISVIVFVYKESGWAYSAGSFVLLASDYAFARADVSIGATEPRDMVGDSKMTEAVSSWIRGVASGSGRNPQIAENFVRENLVISGEEAFSLGITDGIVEDLEELLAVMGVADADVVRVDPSLVEKMFDFLSHPYLVSLFLSLGVLSLILAFRTGEFEISGVFGLILLLLGLWGVGIINFTLLGVVLMLLGIALLGIEIFIVPGFGISGILGIVALIMGILNFSAEPLLAPKIFDFATLFTIGVLITFFALFFIIGRGVVLSYKKGPATGSESLIGRKGVVIKKIEGFGRVEVDKEEWTAKSDEVIEEGEKIEVVSLRGNTLKVKKRSFII